MNYEEATSRLTQLDTAALCDANKIRQGNLRVMDGGIVSRCPGAKLVGKAFTLTCLDDFLTVIKALADAEPGEVLVIDAGQSTKAVTGNLFPTEARRKKLAGIINDGPCRDTQVVRTMGFPYFARSVTCVPGTSNQLFDTQIEITCGGVTVCPGDLVVGDDDGVVVGTIAEFEPLIPIAEDVQHREALLIEGMRSGKRLHDMLNFEEHCSKIAAGEPSQLEFRV